MINILAFKYSSQELNFNEFKFGKPPRKSKDTNAEFDTHDYLYPVDDEQKYGNALSQMYYYFDGGRGKFKIHHDENTLNTNEPYLIYVEYQPDSSSPGPTRQIKYLINGGLDSKHVENVRKGIAKIWIDCTPEERIVHGTIGELVNFLDKEKIPHSSILYTDGDQLVDELFEKYSKDINVKVLPLHMNNAWESFNKLANDNLWSRLIVNQEYFLRPKHFMFNNFMPRLARIILISEIIKSEIHKKGFCSFQDIGEDGNIFFPSMGDASFADRSFNIYDICHIHNENQKIEFKEKYIDVIREVLPLSHDMVGIKQKDTLDNLDYTTARITDGMTLAHSYESALEDEGKRTLTHYDSTYGPYYNPISYLNVYFDVCAETYSGGFKNDMITGGPVFTEKIYRPLALGTPFLPISEPGTIKALQRQGFKIYDNMFDYSFDEEQDGHKRIKMIYDNIKRLTDMSREELHKLTYSHKKEMVYNHEYFINDFYHNVFKNHLKFLTEWVR